MALKPASSKTLLLFFSSLFLFLLLRFWNLSGFLYFIYDQGRDAARLAEIAHGTIALVGPTTGIEGLFLGPLWYYVGLPGYFLSTGNPFGISAWFIALSALAFPGFWWVSRELSKESLPSVSVSERRINKMLGYLTLLFFIALPGSIISSTTIWNPLMAAPLMIASMYCFWRVRQEKHKRRWIAGGFLFAALTLQSEFAYAVFFLPVLFLLIPWMTSRKKVKDFAVAVVAIGVTLLPQLMFEVRHHFIMTTSLLHSLTDSKKAVTWSYQLTHRPLQLINVTIDLFDGPNTNSWIVGGLILALLLLGASSVLIFSRQLYLQKKKATPVQYLKQLILLFAFIPYPFYILWRGNDGNFFSYYLTPHFIFLIPLFVLGLEYLVHTFWKNSVGKAVAISFLFFTVIFLQTTSITHWVSTVASPVNDAGILAMQTAVKVASQMRNPSDSATLIITPNVYSIHYDYLFRWYSQKQHIDTPRTVIEPHDKQLILIIEKWGPTFSDYVIYQRKNVTVGWKLKRVIFAGAIYVEEWVR